MLRKIIVFLLCGGLLTACDPQPEEAPTEEEALIAALQDYAEGQQAELEAAVASAGDATDSIEEILARTSAMLLEELTEEDLERRGELLDEEEYHRRYGLAHAVAEATGLDFVQLANVQGRRGTHGVKSIVEQMPEGERRDAAWNLMMHLDATMSLNPEGAEYVIAHYRDEALDPAAQREAWLQGFARGWEIRVPGTSRVEPTPERSPQAATCAEATGLPFLTLAEIQRRGGTRGLAHTISAIPDVPGEAECLAALE